MSVLDQMRGLWLRQFGDTGERTASDIAQTMRDVAGANTWVQKCAEGVVWQGNFDRDTPLRSTADVRLLSDLARTYGLRLLPCVVPVFRQGTLVPDGQAEFHAAIAKITGCLMVDIEFGPGYWEVHPELIAPYFYALRRQCGENVEIIAQPDPRTAGLDGVRVEAWAQYVDGFCAQHYVGYDAAWNNPAREATQFGVARTRYGNKPVGVTLWGLGDLDTAEDFWTLVREDVREPGPDSVARGFCVFAFGTMNLTQLSWIKRLPDAVQDNPPSPGPDPLPAPHDPADVFRLGLATELAAAMTTALTSTPLDGAALTAHLDAVRHALAAVAPPAPPVPVPAPVP